METITHNIDFLRHKILAACKSANRAPDSVCLLAVGKTFAADKIRAAADAGVVNIGENYLKESMTKIEQLSDLSLFWHFIGHVQNNKSAPVARHFDWVHSVHSIHLARRLSTGRAGMPPLNICLQINLDGEETKNGISPENAAKMATEIAVMPNLLLRGLMTIPNPRCTDKRAPYRALADLQKDLCQKHELNLDTLSMGMSDDFDAAIAEGATHIRIGSAIFGTREKVDING
ncbi:MAG: YggS family pyridoxal phosphate-dependent enzyme [Gammaproteobacteria bacterium WSBS_2016_MAG_OTU1]